MEIRYVLQLIIFGLDLISWYHKFIRYVCIGGFIICNHTWIYLEYNAKSCFLFRNSIIICFLFSQILRIVTKKHGGNKNIMNDNNFGFTDRERSVWHRVIDPSLSDTIFFSVKHVITQTIFFTDCSLPNFTKNE